MGPDSLILVLNIVGAMGYIPHGSIGGKEPLLTEALLREVVERMGKEFNDPAMSFLEYPSNDRHLDLMARASKDLGSEQLLLDYDSLLEGNPNPSLRDPEFLQHSSLSGHKHMTGGAGEGNQFLEPLGLIRNRQVIKTDTVLPAYCNPPNPCPVGYVEDQGCISEFENTAAFSREYQLSQRCMCDGEHMFSCPPDSNHMVNKKYSYIADGDNPFLMGERLPIAAKKGFDVNVY